MEISNVSSLIPTTTPPVGNVPGANAVSDILQSTPLNTISSYVSGAAAGGFATFKSFPKADKPPVDPKIEGSLGNIGKNIGTIAKSAGQAGLQGAKFGAIFGGITSLATNGFELATGKKELSQATGDFVAGTMTAALAGGGGAMAGVATAGIMKAFGVAGKALPIVGTVVGAAAAVGVAALVDSTGLGTKVSDGVKGLFGSSTPTTP